MFGINKGNTAAAVPTSPMGSGALGGAFPVAPSAPMPGILGQLQFGLDNMQAKQAAQQAALTPEQKMRQQTLQAMQTQGQQQPQLSPVQFGGAGNGGGALAQYINMLKGGM